MTTILIIDDRLKEREKIVGLMSYSIPEGSSWIARGIEPLVSIEEYASLITEENIAVLVLDEKLQEQGSVITGVAVDYNGHDLVEFLRPRFPDLPIFVVTAHDDEEDLQNSASDVEGIIPRMAFNQDPGIYTSRMIRSGQRFSEAMEDDLNFISAVSQKLAIGSAGEEDIKKMTGIREKLSLPFPGPDLTEAKHLVPQAEELILQAKSLIEKINARRKDS